MGGVRSGASATTSASRAVSLSESNQASFPSSSSQSFGVATSYRASVAEEGCFAAAGRHGSAPSSSQALSVAGQEKEHGGGEASREEPCTRATGVVLMASVQLL
jgi:hypothetical protein